MLAYELELSLPRARVTFTEGHEQRVILRQRVRQFHKLASNNRPETTADTTRHRLEWVNVETGRVVFNIEQRQPFEIAMDHRGSKANTLVLPQCPVDRLGSSANDGLRPEQLTVVVVSVDADLKTPLSQIPQQAWIVYTDSAVAVANDVIASPICEIIGSVNSGYIGSDRIRDERLAHTGRPWGTVRASANGLVRCSGVE
jgi:hypothetical protein